MAIDVNHGNIFDLGTVWAKSRPLKAYRDVKHCRTLSTRSTNLDHQGYQICSFLLIVWVWTVFWSKIDVIPTKLDENLSIKRNYVLVLMDTSPRSETMIFHSVCNIRYKKEYFCAKIKAENN